MNRLCAALVSGLLALALMPAAASADPVSKATDHFVTFSCDQEFDGGFASAFLELSTAEEFQFLDVALWFDPDNPFDTLPTVSGTTGDFELADDGSTIEVQATIPVFDPDGNSEGDAELAISVTRTGDVFLIGPDAGKTNVNSKTSGMEERVEGSGSVTWDGDEIILSDCDGVVVDVDFFSTNPRAFVTSNTGVAIDCFWETETAIASLFAANDGFGFFVDAFLSSDDIELFSFGEHSGSLDITGVDLDIPLEGTQEGSATATATFSPNGSPVTSTHVSETAHSRVTEQALIPTGTIEFSTGESFAIDDEHCDARWFDSHSSASAPAGPKRAAAPTNDGPDGAIALHVGSRFNTSTVGAAAEPEIQLENCPEGFVDQFGNTLWYTIEGTGSPITIDTAGSNFDTLIAVYLPTDTGFEEIACIDDVEFEPIGSTLQAALTFDTEDGVTYYVQIGGFDFPFDEEVIGQKGRLRIRVR